MSTKKKTRQIHIGTSGWSYAHWRNTFYPEGLPSRAWLDYYQQHFLSTELNRTFYKLPSEDTFRSWSDAVPKDFVFAVKASRFTTHMKKLKDPAESADRFFERLPALGKKIGPILFQLPPGWSFNRERLAAFLEKLPKSYRYAFEFRHHSWLNDDCYALLEKHRASCCIYHLAGFRSPEVLTTDFVYLRLHGPGDAYQGSYNKRALNTWARKISDWVAAGKTVYCYFDNDQEAYAANNALTLSELLGNNTGAGKVGKKSEI